MNSKPRNNGGGTAAKRQKTAGPVAHAVAESVASGVLLRKAGIGFWVIVSFFQRIHVSDY